MFRTPNHRDYEINCTDLNASTAEEMPFSRAYSAWLTNDHPYKNHILEATFGKKYIDLMLSMVSLLQEEISCIVNKGTGLKHTLSF
jgi:hypothetical protein